MYQAQCQILYLWAPESLWMVTVAMKSKRCLAWKKSSDKSRPHSNKPRYHFANKGPYSQSCGFSNSQALLSELAHDEGWAPKNWCFWIAMLEKTLKSPLDYKEIKLSILKEINPEYSLEGWCWSWSSNTSVTWCEEPTHWKRPWYWERLKAKGEGGDRRWDGWIASSTQWTWTWANSMRQCRTEEPGML